MNFREFADRAPVWLCALVGLALAGQGVRYLITPEIAPYHIALIGEPWDSVASNYQRLLLGLYRGFGAGFLCVGFAVLVLMLGPLRNGQRWAAWATPAVAGTYCAAFVLITYSALLPGAAPVVISVALLGLVVIAALLSFFGWAVLESLSRGDGILLDRTADFIIHPMG